MSSEHPVAHSAVEIAVDDGPKKSPEEERAGLTTDEVDKLYEKWGFNELPVVEIPLWKVFLMQYTGTMPYMLELAIIISAAVQDWPDFGIIIAMVSKNLFFYFNKNQI